MLKRLQPYRRALAGAVAVMYLMEASRAVAHDSPDHLVEVFTAQIARKGATPHLLYQRATEYRALGKVELAAADLEAALKLRPNYVIALQDLSRLYLEEQKLPSASAVVERALQVVSAEAERAPFYITRAELHKARGEPKLSLADCNRAFQYGAAELDWYLLRAEIQSSLGQFEACASGLEEGFRKIGSVVLEIEWIEALIDAGQFEKARQKIDAQLEDSRWRSSWLVRRARAKLGLHETASAREDLHNALAEIQQRLKPDRPNIPLLVERGLAYALLDRRTEASQDFEAAKKLGAAEPTLRRLKSLIAG